MKYKLNQTKTRQNKVYVWSLLFELCTKYVESAVRGWVTPMAEVGSGSPSRTGGLGSEETLQQCKYPAS